ncbi:FmdB family zinc ribbon protein [Sphingomonas hengshuiensis]|uniref:FmdB family transcriptional regulator n=1 Tax=Sphingomonas hengshuiensis TaxID=1609977 RepID=A0A7U5BFX5_9SPHN|nr:zinc ribbon domain-containing protein [Sphingomonas hengshuiensis]AJP74531.1 FmdB family transcriptional regulator [Sphingomonas hengshuiensis]
MPIYDFHCPKCDGIVELLVRFSDTPGCPACGHAQLERLVGVTAPPGKSAALAKAWRARAGREGHLSNFE